MLRGGIWKQIGVPCTWYTDLFSRAAWPTQAVPG